MNPEVFYLLKANLILTVLGILYWLFLRKVLHPGWHRIILLLLPMISILFPLLDLSSIKNFNPLISQNITESPWLLDQDFPDLTKVESSQAIKVKIPWILIYLAGCGFIFISVSVSILKNIKLIRKYGILKIENTRVIPAENVPLPYSFMQYIFLSPSQYDPVSRRIILLHENSHVSQLHYLDLILYEFYRMFFWFNPAIYALKRSLKECHEYLADQSTLKNGVDLHSYIRLLVRHVDQSGILTLSNSFTKFNLYNRLKMIQNIQKPRQGKKYLPFLLSTVFFLLSFSILNSAFSFTHSYSLTFQQLDDNPRESGIPSISPVDLSLVTRESGFGMRMHPFEKVEVMHKGHDFACPPGTPVWVTADGVVTETGYKPEGSGRFIKIAHKMGFETFYSQLESIDVNEGQKVQQGQQIGTVGSSGLSTGPHLHYQVMKEGEPKDPKQYFKAD